jgi:predicted PurR-regulated permease PerM
VSSNVREQQRVPGGNRPVRCHRSRGRTLLRRTMKVMQFDPTPDERGWFSRERVLTILLGLTTLLAFFVCYRIVAPFIPAVAIATAVAVATNRQHNWLRRRFQSKAAAASVSVVLVAGVIVIPLSFLIAYLVRQIIDGIQQLQAGGGPAAWWNGLPLPPAVVRAIDWAQTNLDLQGQLTQLGQILAEQAGGLLAGSVTLLTQLVIMLFVLFFLYRDRDRALDSLRGLLPMSGDEANQILSRVGDTILATVNGSITVAFVQALLAGAMYTILGVPGSMVWASATFIVALVPVFGTFLVWGPVALFLFASGSWVKAIILVGWGLLAVGSIDNVLYPYLVGGRLRLHTIPTFFAIVGGIAEFGPAGLIIGPVALAITIGLLHVWRWRTAGGRAAETPAAPRSPLGIA